jgi:hypothetical protein
VWSQLGWDLLFWFAQPLFQPAEPLAQVAHP